MKNYRFVSFIQIIILLSIMTFLTSCNDGKKKIEKEIIQMQSQPIIIPQKGIIKMKGRDTIKFVSDTNELFKLIVYHNRLSCSSCKLSQISKWSNFIDYAERFDGKFAVYFIFSAPKKELNQLFLTLNNTGFDYPIIIDTKNEFERLNPHLPSNMSLHTFLLDENNNAIIIGNPLQNKQIEKMIHTYVDKRLSNK